MDKHSRAEAYSISDPGSDEATDPGSEGLLLFAKIPTHPKLFK